jgi:hypothetical protein
VFIDLFVGHIHFRALGNDERKLHPLPPRALALEQDASHPRENQLADGAPLGRGLFFQLPVKRNRDIHRSANGIVLHNRDSFHMP